MSDSVARMSVPAYFSQERRAVDADGAALLRRPESATYSPWHVATMPHLDVENQMTETNLPTLRRSEASR
jgi:hypothetical protein